MADLFEKLWNKYTEDTPSAARIHALFGERGETIVNDHIAIRTFNDSRVGIEVMAKPFLKLGFEECGEYHFPAKKLYAKHFQHPTNKELPKVFISELRLELMPSYVQETVGLILDSVDAGIWESENLVLEGRPWATPSYETYKKLREVSEYAAWMYVYGFCANHFTVNVNELSSFNTLQEVNAFLRGAGFTLNESGGAIKGTSEQMLEQSSILADLKPIEFREGNYEVPTCYYEFAKRYSNPEGLLFQGFIADSADKIFESTDAKLRQS